VILMSTRCGGKIATGIWVTEKSLILAKKKIPDFNLSHYVDQQLQKDFDSVESQVDSFLSKREPDE